MEDSDNIIFDFNKINISVNSTEILIKTPPLGGVLN